MSARATESKARRPTTTQADLILQKAPFGFILADRRNQVIELNEAAAEILGVPASELLGASWTERSGAAPPSRPSRGTREIPWQRQDGQTIILEVVTDRLRMDGQTVFTHFFRDITGRKNTERVQQALYEIGRCARGAEHLDDFLAAIHPLLHSIIPSTTCFVGLYDASTRQWTYPFKCGVSTPAGPRKAAKKLEDRVLETRQPVRLSQPGTRAQLRKAGYSLGRPRPRDWLGVPLKEGRRVIGVLALADFDSENFNAHDEALLQHIAGEILDLLQRLRAEDALRAREERFRRHFEEDLTGDFIARPDGRLLSCNPAFAAIFGYADEKQAVRRKLSSLFANRRDWTRLLEALRRDPHPQNHEFRMRRRDRSAIDLLVRIIGVFDETRELKEIRGYLIDITERKQLEEQVRQSQKIEAIGRLAGGVAHDFNNLLTPIIGYGRLILDEAGLRAPYRDDLKQIVHAGERAADLTRKLLAFGRKQLIRTRPLDVQAVLREMDPLLRRTIGPDVELTLDLEELPAIVRADPGQLEHVVMNLCLNARDAMPHGGRLTIRVRLARLDASNVPPACAPGEYVLLSVTDTGSGMSRRVREHAFEPFFTTKESGKGTGLGLSTVYGVIRQFGGHIELESRLHRGTRVTLFLPHSEETSIERPPPQEGEIPRGRETILLVDDDDAVRESISRMLTSLGYRLIEARNAGEALLAAEQHKKPIDLLLTDVVMPRMGGAKLVKRLKKMRRDFKVLYTSGYAADTVADLDINALNRHFLQKPYTRKTLGQAVRRILDADR